MRAVDPVSLPSRPLGSGSLPVVAVDLDEVAVEVAALTALVNGVEIDVRRADVLRDELPRTDVVVANIELPVVERFLERLVARFAVTSGYLESETPAVSGWTRVDRLELEGWAADVFSLTAPRASYTMKL